MKDEKFDYPFPNGVAAFWIFVAPPLILFIVIIGRVIAQADEWGDGSNVVGASIMLGIALFLATLVANSYPAVSVGADRLSVRFYFLFFSHWVRIGWDEVEGIRQVNTPNGTLGSKQRGLFRLTSTRLPVFYHLPMLLFAHSFRKGFLIDTRLHNFDRLMSALQSRTT